MATYPEPDALGQLRGLYRRKLRRKGSDFDPYNYLMSKEEMDESKRRFDVGLETDKSQFGESMDFARTSDAARAEADAVARADAAESAKKSENLSLAGLGVSGANLALKIPGVTDALKGAGSSIYNSLKGITTPSPSPVTPPAPALGPEASVGELGASATDYLAGPGATVAGAETGAALSEMYAPIAEDVLAGGSAAIGSEGLGAAGSIVGGTGGAETALGGAGYLPGLEGGSSAGAGAGALAGLGPAAFAALAAFVVSKIFEENNPHPTTTESLLWSPASTYDLNKEMWDKQLWEVANQYKFSDQLAASGHELLPTEADINAIGKKYGIDMATLYEPDVNSFMRKWGKVSIDPATQAAWWGQSEEGID